MATPPPPPTTMTAPSAYIEDAASAAAAMVLATATLRSSSASGADNGGDAVDGDKGDSCSGAAPGGRARLGRAIVTGSRPFLPPHYARPPLEAVRGMPPRSSCFWTERAPTALASKSASSTAWTGAHRAMETKTKMTTTGCSPRPSSTRPRPTGVPSVRCGLCGANSMPSFALLFACIVCSPRPVWPTLTTNSAAARGAVLLHLTIVLYSACHVRVVEMSLSFPLPCLFLSDTSMSLPAPRFSR